MCGVFGTTRPDLWEAHIGSVLASLRHRGPDGNGTWLNPDRTVLLAHTRLAIIGPGQTGSQPATSSDNDITLSFNGEIYNFRELHGQGSQSDTSVLCELLAKQGTDGLSQLRGMYASAAWDARTSTFMAFRDPWGIKPLYVLRHPTGGVTVSSEIPVLLSLEALEVDPVGIARYLLTGHTGSSITSFRNVSKLPIGVVMSWQKQGNGWVERSSRIGSHTHPQRIFADAFAESMRYHLVSDVEVGVFLSGGMDSTLIAAVARSLQPEVRTFTIAFPDHPAFDESRRAEVNARSLDVRFTAVPVTALDLAPALDRFLTVHGEPFGDAAALPLVKLSEYAATQVKVVLAGEGADELFGGYGRYRVSSRLSSRAAQLGLSPLKPLAKRWSKLRGDSARDRALEAILWGQGMSSHSALLGGEEGWAAASGLPWAVDADRYAGAEWAALSGEDHLDRSRQYDLIHWLPNVYLEKTDRATMAMSLEARVPFLDPAVTASPRAIGKVLKEPIQAELYRRLPDVLLPDHKKGLAVPISALLARSLHYPRTDQLCSESSVLRRTLGASWQAALRSRADRSAALSYRVAVLGRWAELFSDSIKY